MNQQTDAQLLRNYAENRSEAAFAELVRRHVDFVYSAALRMVRDAHLAEDVTQGVFVALAKNASQLIERPVLSGWLHRTGQNIAAQTVRTIERRRAREQEAAAMNELLTNESEISWETIAPYLDAALGELNEAERDAVLLRYFEKKSAQEMAGILGISDEAAQKRVSRAVERLREFLSKRNVTIGGSGLVVLISANAVQSAPVGLTAAISAAAILTGTTVSTSAAIAASKVIAMTALQKTIIGATLVAAIGTGIFEAHRAAQLRDRNQTLQEQQTSLAKQVQQLRRQRDNAEKRLARLSARPVPRLPAPPIKVTLSTDAPVEKLEPTNWYARLKDIAPKLTVDQVEAYLKADGRTASNLLAAYRTSGDQALLREAMEKYPNDPQVAFEAALDKNLSPEERRRWLNAFEQSAPDNALANYLSALNYFNSGLIDQGVRELAMASGKTLDDYTVSRAENDMEAYLAAGYSVADAEQLGTSQLLLPQLARLKQLVLDCYDLANAYRQAGDATSAETVLQMADKLGQQYATPSAGEPAISQLVGIVMERIALGAMDSNALYGDNGQTVQDRLNQLAQQKAAVEQLSQQVGELLPAVSDQDLIIYKNRWLMFGEENAQRWLITKYRRQ